MKLLFTLVILLSLLGLIDIIIDSYKNVLELKRQNKIFNKRLNKINNLIDNLKYELN